MHICILECDMWHLALACLLTFRSVCAGCEQSVCVCVCVSAMLRLSNSQRVFLPCRSQLVMVRVTHSTAQRLARVAYYDMSDTVASLCVSLKSSRHSSFFIDCLRPWHHGTLSDVASLRQYALNAPEVFTLITILGSDSSNR